MFLTNLRQVSLIRFRAYEIRGSRLVGKRKAGHSKHVVGRMKLLAKFSLLMGTA